MAARKEILDFIIQEQTTTPPKWQEVEVYALRILEAYNERRADTLTLQNDLNELVASCKMCEQRGIKDATPNFEVAVMLLLQTALDWNICLPESEIKRYKNVKLFIIDNLAKYIRKTYRHHQMQHKIPPAECPKDLKLLFKKREDAEDFFHQYYGVTGKYVAEAYIGRSDVLPPNTERKGAIDVGKILYDTFVEPLEGEKGYCDPSTFYRHLKDR